MSWMSPDFFIQLLVAVGASGAVAQVITSFRERRKLGAEAGDLLQQAAGRQVERLEREIERLRKQQDDDYQDFEEKLEGERTKNRKLRAALTIRRQWEDEVYQIIRQQGISIPEPPPWDL